MARERYVITKEQVKECNTYIPLDFKTKWVNKVAENCIDKLEITTYIDGNETLMPPMYKENLERKSRYLMGAFVVLYLRGGFEPDTDEDENLMPVSEYDKWAGGHIFNQIERFKHDSELKEICFDMLSDYKDLEKRLNTECYSMLQAMNDDVARQLTAMQASVTPESMQEILGALESAKNNKQQTEEE